MLTPIHLSAILFNSDLRREHIYFSDTALTLNYLKLLFGTAFKAKSMLLNASSAF